MPSRVQVRTPPPIRPTRQHPKWPSPIDATWAYILTVYVARSSRLRKNRGLTPISQRKPLILRERSCEMGCLTPVFPQPARKCSDESGHGRIESPRHERATVFFMLEAPAPRPCLPWIPAVREQYSSVIVGQRALLDRLLAALITGNHVLIEGVPGLGKTLAILTLARSLDATFHRIQFTPDLLPSDIVGTLIYDARTGEFTPRKGPVFANIVLADEVNRAPAKVQSALLEAMQDRQVTIGD